MEKHLKQTGPVLLRHFILSWLAAVMLEYFRLPEEFRDLGGLACLEQMDVGRIFTPFFLIFAGLILISSKYNIRQIECTALLIVFSCLACISGAASFSWPYFTVCMLIFAGIVIYWLYGWKQSETVTVKRIYLYMTLVFALGFFLFVSIWSVYRIKSYVSSTYDMGLFSQMFHYMKTTGKPLTTLERNGLLSHFKVHVSPVYYLMLPFFMLASSPETLAILQAAVMTSAVIPLWLLCKQHGLSDWQKMLMCVLLMLFPAFAGGAGYDLHENCFLTPLLLWLLYGIDRGRLGVIIPAAILTLMVKEDAPVYVAVVGLYALSAALLNKKSWKSREVLTGAGLMAGALLYFVCATAYLRNVGDGVMTYRYDNFMYGDSSSLTTVIKSVLINPMKAVYECVDKEKVQYILLTMLPLLGLPLITRRYERYLLLIPYLLINLMSDYAYQHDIFFQYSFGSTACLLYLTIVNLADLKQPGIKAAFLAGAVLLSVLCFWKVVVPEGTYYTNYYEKNQETFQEIRQTLSEIPEDASVASVGKYTTTLSQRDEIYAIGHCSARYILESDYVVVGNQDFDNWISDGIDGREALLEALNNEGYQPWKAVGDALVIYSRTGQN